MSHSRALPPPAPRSDAILRSAHGLFKATLRGTTLNWKLALAKLTGPATAAHIHQAAKGKFGNVIRGRFARG